MKTIICLLAATMALVSSAMAQSGNTVSILGEVTNIAANAVTVKQDDSGVALTFSFSPTLVVLQNKPANLSDIRPHDFVASAAIRGVDGKLHSTELRIFPEALRGVGEGQRQMGDPRGQMMTNATVTGAVVVNGTDTMEVTFPGGKSQLVLDPGVPVTRIDTVDRSLVKTGSHVRVQGTGAGTDLVATRITLQ